MNLENNVLTRLIGFVEKRENAFCMRLNRFLMRLNNGGSVALQYCISYAGK